MKLNKTMFIVCIAILGIFTVAQLSYAYTMMVNLGQQTDGKDVVKNVEDAVKKAGEENKNPEKLASNQTLFETKPDLFAENMVGTINLPASELQADDAVRSLADFIIAGAEGKNVIILGETKEQADLVKNKLAQSLKLEGIEGERLFFAITTNVSLISAVRDLFTINQGAFRLCTGDNLAPAVREALKGAV